MTEPLAFDSERRTDRYVGRFAPSPTGALHAGSLVAALASWLDARAHGGRWLIRLEDTDTPRCSAESGQTILAQLAACGLKSDEPVVWQSHRTQHYQDAWARLMAAGQLYPCSCTRSRIQAHWKAVGHTRQRDRELAYPGLCRNGTHEPARAWRLRCSTPGDPLTIDWHDRWLGTQSQNVTEVVGDMVLKRADGLWAYQLAVVVDDALQGVTHVVRGADLADNTARQVHLQRLLGYPSPRYLHVPVVTNALGQKLSKQSGAPPLRLQTTEQVAQALGQAASWLGLTGLDERGSAPFILADWQARAIGQWSSKPWFCAA